MYIYGRAPSAVGAECLYMYSKPLPNANLKATFPQSDAQQEQHPPAKESAALVPSGGQPLASLNGHTTSDEAPLSVKEDCTQPVHGVEPDSGIDPRSTSVSDLQPDDLSNDSHANVGQEIGGDGIQQLSNTVASVGSVPEFHHESSSTSISEFPSGTEEQQSHSHPLVNEHDQQADEITTSKHTLEVNYCRTESSLSTEESQVSVRNELVLFATHKDQDPNMVVERMETLTLDVKRMNKNLTEQIFKLKEEVKVKDKEIEKLENEKRESDKMFTEEIQKLEKIRKEDKSKLEELKTLVAELEQKVTAKDHEIKELKESLRERETSAERSDLHSQGKDALQQQIDRLTEELTLEKQKAEQKEKEIGNLKYQLMEKKYELEQKKYEMEHEDNDYKDKMRQVERERDAIKVKYEQILRQQAEEQKKHLEEKNRRLEEEMKQLKLKLDMCSKK